MFKLHAVQAQFGDSLILEYGTPAKRRYTLIDGGPPDTFDPHLAAALKETVKPKGKLDLLILSHVDNDHVIGVLDLLAALEADDVNGKDRRVRIGGLWHNSFQRTIDPNGEVIQRLQNLMAMATTANLAMPLTADAFFGIFEGNRLRILAKKLKIAINKGFTDNLILVDTAKKAIKQGPMTLRVVGPGKANLDTLRADWLKWLAKAENAINDGPAVAANSDQSVPNLSSIVLLAQCNGKTALLTGDARGDHILDGLAQAGLLTNGKLHVDLLKVQHHGSNRNATFTFFKTVTADKYVISADGKHENPDHETLKWIVEAAKAAGRQIEIFVTNETASTKKLKQTHKPAQHTYKLTVMPKTAHRMEIVLA